MIGLNSYLGLDIDFSTPKGEPGLCGPDSVSWRIFKNPVALAVGGVAAVILEFADPRIRSAVWDYSSFKTNPAGRAQRTGTAALIGVYAARSLSVEIISRINRMHGQIEGFTPNGTPYTALDEDLLEWVGATATFGFLTAYDRYVKPLSDMDKRQFYKESAETGRYYRVQSPLDSPEAFSISLNKRLAGFEPHPIIFEFIDIMCSGRAAPWAPRHLQRILVRAAISILPPEIRDRLEMTNAHLPKGMDAYIVTQLAGLADRLPDPRHPVAQASRRYGLPWNYAWKTLARQRALYEGARIMQPDPVHS